MHRAHTADNYSAVIQGFNDRLQAILPLIEEKAEEAEQLGRMHDDVVDAMRKGGFYTMLFPKEVGGAELRPVDAMKIMSALSYAHASSGWCTMVNNMEGTTMAIYLDDEGIANVFKDGVDITIAGNGVPRGFARKVDGGYMIRGNWAYGSSIFHAEWIHSGCFLLDPKDPNGKALLKDETGAPQIIVAHHPRSTIQLLGNWDVLGLRATGSFDYTLATDEDLFVPDSMVYSFTQSAPKRGQSQGHLGLAGYSALTHTSWAIGVGRRILDELAKVIRQRQDPFGKSADSASLRFQFANAEARYRAARALAMETWEDVSQTTASGGVPTLDQMTMVKLSLRYMHDIVSDVATFAHRAARGASLHNTAMQRFYRDIHSGTQHILLADQIVEECGKGLLGLSGPGARWTVFGISEN
ncbi:acyl-CoA dehydrogenase family protein [Brucella haematophila]|uniref:acyl-CoA dehydrogenase family protein n=1 Tax=Brucella haematophila TaxID=419474 RepID=UPI001F2D6B60|nr:acyl-CoA dehydrogenase family protein [Brucella haematophila]